ncbi:hypothetical protein niasHS_004880 [Heterodera schachtii]|uniref:Uncharacterized protein n=1 Tax=Heterodera schachtii TaxID=97005 RepID=A0ABD2JLH1_HETSC
MHCGRALIVLGTIETLFLVWSIRLVEQSPFFTASSESSARQELFEGRLILLPALAVSLTISTRLGTGKYEGLLDALRTLLLLSFALSLVPAFAYSVTFFVPALADIVTHYMEKVPF